MQNRYLFIFSLGLVLILGSTTWGKTGNLTKQGVIIYSGNTSGFTDPSG
jgi:hypothetical protein